MAMQRNSFGDVHATVLRQHTEIRARLQALDMAGAQESSPVTITYLRVSLLRLAVLLETHLRFEEQELVPRIRELDSWGPAREAAMLTEHAEQRERIKGVCMTAENESTVELQLAQEVSRLVVSLLDDMAREERELAELGRDAEGLGDQMTG